MAFDRIPEELQRLNQWVCWKYVKRDDGKWTKTPVDPKRLTVANVTDRQNYSDFTTAVSTSQSVPGIAGIGFVLTPYDDYSFTDLDDPYAMDAQGNPKYTNPDEIMQQQRMVYESMLSYAELSPSGKGLHIIAKGATPEGKRRGAIELYTTARYMTMTGNVYRDMAITDQQPAIDWLYGMLGGKAADTPSGIPQSMLFQADKQPDDEVLKHAFSAANGVKFQSLYEGRFSDAGYGSQSEADWALIDQLQFYTTSRQQIRRLFMASGLGQRDKAKRPGYVESMIDRSFDRVPPEIDLDAMSMVLDAQRDREAAAREEARMAASAGSDALVKHAFSEELPQDDGRASPEYDPSDPSPYLQPIPGLLGSIAYFIYRSAPRPVPEIAVAGAIGLMAGISGRAFNVNSTGLNVYLLLLARTGRGKEAIATGIQRLMKPVKQMDGGGGVPGADEFIGPQEIASGQALIKYMAKTSRSFVSIMSEFDGFLSGLTARNAPQPIVRLKQVLLYSYGRSGAGQQIDKSIYSEAEKNVPVIPSPAMSLVGEGTPERFYELLSEQLISDGFLPRFSVIEYEGPRVASNPNFMHATPEPDLVSALARLCAHCLTLNSKETTSAVLLTPEAKELLDRFDRECDRRCNKAGSDAVTQLWNRAHLKSLKLAALIAVGVNWYAPVIEAAHAVWAINCARYDTGKLASRFETGMIGIASADTRQIMDVKRKLLRLFDGKSVDGTKYKLPPEALRAGIFNSFYLQGAVSNIKSFSEDKRGATAAYHAMVMSLVRMGVIDELNRADKEKLNVLGAAYIVRSWEWLKS